MSNPRSFPFVIDFAGGGVVHLAGGVLAFVAALFLGPREGRFSTNADGKRQSTPIKKQSAMSATIGVFLLWVSGS